MKTKDELQRDRRFIPADAFPGPHTQRGSAGGTEAERRKEMRTKDELQRDRRFIPADAFQSMSDDYILQNIAAYVVWELNAETSPFLYNDETRRYKEEYVTEAKRRGLIE